MQETEILALFDEYSDMLFRIALSYIRQSQDAEDAVQSVFMKLIDGTARPEIGKERAFLTRITINHCKDVLRSVWKRLTEPLDDEFVFKQEEDSELYTIFLYVFH